MSDQSLYGEDILLWSEQQAAAIRRLGRTGRGISNDLDIENVAEEIESVGRSELAAVKSEIRLIFVHLIKLVAEPNAGAVRHWRGKIVSFHSEVKERYAPSMRQRIDVDVLWRSAREQSLLAREGAEQSRVAGLATSSPFTLDDLLHEAIDSVALVERLREMD
jgi:hypothetical protein